MTIASKEQPNYYEMHVFTGWYDTNIFVLSIVSIVEPVCPRIASLKPFRLEKDSGIGLLFISESAIFFLYYPHKQHVSVS